VGIITSTIHPYAYFWVAIWGAEINQPVMWQSTIDPPPHESYYNFSHVHRVKRIANKLKQKHPLPRMGVDINIGARKASIGMYRGCDYPHKYCLCTFWLCHPYFILQLFFYTCANYKLCMADLCVNEHDERELMEIRVWQSLFSVNQNNVNVLNFST
jgi:hypothetical protein